MDICRAVRSHLLRRRALAGLLVRLVPSSRHNRVVPVVPAGLLGLLVRWVQPVPVGLPRPAGRRVRSVR